MKKVFTAILAVIVILGMAAGYLITGLNIQPAQPQGDDGFTGPTGEPYVVGPSQAQIDLLNKTR